VDFQAVELRHGEGFFNASSDVVEVSEGGVSVDVGFPAEGLVPVDGEFEEKAAFFGAGEFDKAVDVFFEAVHLAFGDFEIGMDTD